LYFNTGTEFKKPLLQANCTVTIRKWAKFLSHVRYNFTNRKTGTGFTKFPSMAKCTFTNQKRGQGLRNSWCRSTLETLAQLHGTGLAFKKSVGGHKEILKLFPALEEQIQVKVHTYSPYKGIVSRELFVYLCVCVCVLVIPPTGVGNT
jgi:hypothetical protein